MHGWLDAAYRAADHRTGLAPYYPFLYACALGLRAQRVLEFGAGESSVVLCNALRQTGGHLVSVSTDPQAAATETWTHLCGQSADAHPRLPAFGPFDLVLHDGSHAADVVEDDLLAALPHVRQWGLVLVHDARHSYVGPAVRGGIDRAVRAACDDLSLASCELTLPFAFGLTVIKVLGNAHLGAVRVDGADKPGSPHHTEGPAPLRGG